MHNVITSILHCSNIKPKDVLILTMNCIDECLFDMYATLSSDQS